MSHVILFVDFNVHIARFDSTRLAEALGAFQLLPEALRN